MQKGQTGSLFSGFHRKKKKSESELDVLEGKSSELFVKISLLIWE